AVTDSFDTGAWAAGTVLGDAAAGVRDSHLLLPPGLAPFTAASSTYELFDHKERRWFSRLRETCCFAYQLPKPTVCFTCPRIDDGERVDRASGWPDP
ncbi:MAG: (2Fe-2S)-binding protein, partial [Candidatus Nanopelagicales bacterium]